MPTLLHPEITKAFGPRMAGSFVDDVTVLGILHVHEKQLHASKGTHASTESPTHLYTSGHITVPTTFLHTQSMLSTCSL